MTTKLSVHVEIKVSMETLKSFPPIPQGAILELVTNFDSAFIPPLKVHPP